MELMKATSGWPKRHIWLVTRAYEVVVQTRELAILGSSTFGGGTGRWRTFPFSRPNINRPIQVYSSNTSLRIPKKRKVTIGEAGRSALVVLRSTR